MVLLGEQLQTTPAAQADSPSVPKKLQAHYQNGAAGGKGDDSTAGWDVDVSKVFIFRLTTEGAPCSQRIQASESLC